MKQRDRKRAAKAAESAEQWWVPLEKLDRIVKAEGIDTALTPYEVVKEAERKSLRRRIDIADKNKASARKPRDKAGKLPAQAALLAEYQAILNEPHRKRTPSQALAVLCRRYPDVSKEGIRSKLKSALERAS